MTRIIKLEAKGFKSFANKTELVFEDRFNCIIGPNGSGKSNVFDAFCFVLGKGSAKGLRAEKGANLIYNGGKAKTPAKTGEVSIYFDNTKREFPVEEDVIKVSRIIKQSGVSTYKINDQTHTRAQLLEFLSKASVDPDGYNIILQGDIVRFVEMSGIERRQVIEEMAGIGIYEEKKIKALKELDKVQKGIDDGNIILTERSAYLKELKNERDQAIRFKDAQAKLLGAKKKLVQMSMNKKDEELEKIDVKGKERKVQIDTHQQKIDDNKAKVKQFKDDVVAINKEIETKGEKEQVAMHKQIEELKITIATNKHRIETCDNEIERVQARVGSLNESLKDMRSKMSEASANTKKYKEELASKQSLLKEIGAKVDKLKKKFNLEGASEIEKRIEEIDQEADNLQKDIAKIREGSQDALREKDRLEIQIENMDQKIEKVKEVEKENKAELDKLKQKRVEFKKATVELSQALSEDQKAASKITQLRQHYQTAAEEVSRMEARQAAMLERQSGDIAIKKLIENKSKIGGIHGTVSSLGSVDKKFNIALEIAGGNKLKGIVVDDDKTAAKCIQYLRENQLGVASFFPLNKIKARKKKSDVDAIADARGAHGYAIDLVEFDSQYRNVMSFVFGNTVVIDNLDVARRLGIGSAKMVTLDGDMAEESGAMRGGYQKRRASGSVFSEKNEAKKLTKAQTDAEQTRARLEEMQQSRTDNEEKIVKLRELKATLEGEIIKTEKSLFMDADDANVSLELKNEFKDKLKDVEKSVRENNNEVMKVTRKVTDLKIERQKLRSQVTDIRNPTKLAELNSFEEQQVKLRESIAGLQARIEQEDKQASQMYGPETENIKKIIKQHEKEIETFSKEKDTINKQTKDQTKDLKEKEEKEKAFYQKFKKLLDKRNTLQADIEKTESTIIALEEKIRDLERQNNVLSIEIARIKAEKAALEEELEQYKDVEPVEEVDIEKLKRQIWQQQQRLDQLGNVNLKALDTYEKIEKEYGVLLEKKQKLEEEKETVLKIMEQIETKKIELFTKIFDVLNTNFKKLFQSLSSKGDAYLELENPDSPFEGGVFIKVRLTGKKFMDIRSLSGGEKTMTALAFIFAIQEYLPASFYVFDEVDAALDKKNAERLAKLVNDYADKAQYIIISHNDGVISSADQLYGVSMNEHGISKVVSLKL